MDKLGKNMVKWRKCFARAACVDGRRHARGDICMEQRRQTILIADDSQLSRSVLSDILSSHYHTLEAENGIQVLDLLQQQEGRIDLLVLDLVMPKINGFQVLEAMAQRDWLKNFPVLVIAGEGGNDQIEQAYALGADDHIRHPFSAPIVRQRVTCNLLLYEKELAHGCLRPWREWSQLPSDRTMKLLEHEWTKFRFFSSLSREIQFEYSAPSDTLKISERSASYLGVDTLQVSLSPGSLLYQVIRPEDVEALTQLLEHSTPDDPVVEYPCSIQVKGERRWGKIVSMAIWAGGRHPEYQGAIGKFVDTHEEHSRIQALERIASHDGLTGLLNRNTVSHRVDELLREHPEKNFALAVVDLDHFKEANDQYGHLFGDQVLKHVADKLRKSIRNTDLAARVGGDEFLLFMGYADQVYAQVDRVFHSLRGSFQSFPISVSMGVARSSINGGRDYQTLFSQADRALYAAKWKGRDCYCFYDDSMEHMSSVLSPIESDTEQTSQDGKKEEHRHVL